MEESDFVEIEDPFEGASLVGKFESSIIQKVEDAIDHEIGVVASVGAMQTISSYMREFRDDVTCDWMNAFDDYKKLGFENGWTKYVENMIVLDAFNIDVNYRPPKGFRTKDSKPGATNVVLQYTYEIQPRKVAHQFVTVRENICTEMIDDIKSVVTENKEAKRFAQDYFNNDREYAESHRHSTRQSDLGGSTPFRNKNYNSCAVLITNLALDLVKMDLEKNGHQATIQFIDDLLAKIEGEIDKLSPTERHIRQRLYASGPRALIEELYYMGISTGVDKDTGTNYMKLAESVLSTRVAVSVIMCKTLDAQNSNARAYYGMIKDYGGFQRLNLKGDFKMRIVDLDELADDEKAKVEDEVGTPAQEASAAPSVDTSSQDRGADELGLVVDDEGNLWGDTSSGFEPMSM